MIVRSCPRSFCYFTQHHHAEVAAQLAAQWRGYEQALVQQLVQVA